MGVGRRCATCDAAVALDARFCAACGAGLAPDAQTTRAANPRRSPLRWMLPLMLLGAAGAAAMSPAADGRARWHHWHEWFQRTPSSASSAEAPPAPLAPLAPRRTADIEDAEELEDSDLLGDAPPLAAGLSIRRTSPEAGLADRLRSHVLEVRGDLRGTQRLRLEFDPAEVEHPVVVEVLGGVIARPVRAEIGEGAALVEADVSMTSPAAPAFLQAPEHANRTPPPPVSIGYAIAEAFHPSCRTGSRGEVEFASGSRVAIGFLEDADCELGRRVAALVGEAMAHFDRTFADAEGSPLRRYTTSSPLLVFLHHHPGVNGAYSVWSPRGHVYVDIAAAGSNFEGLRETIYHELFHAVQDHYATMSAVGVLGSLWWFEGSAEWAGLVARGVEFDAAIVTELRAPALLSIPMEQTGAHGDMSYGTSLYMYWAEQREPGFVLRLLQPSSRTGSDMRAATPAAAGFPNSYRAFVERVVRAAPNESWSQARLIVRDSGVRFQQAVALGGEMGAWNQGAWSEPVGDRTLEWTMRSVTFVAQPMTAHFVRLHVVSSEPVRLGLGTSTERVFRPDGPLSIEGGQATIDPLGTTTLVFYNDQPTSERVQAMFFLERGEEPTDPDPPPDPPPEPRPPRPDPPRADPTPRAAPRDLSGAWRVSYGCMNLSQSGARVTGEVFGHRHADTGRARGSIADGVLTLTYSLGSTERTLRVRLATLPRARGRTPGGSAPLVPAAQCTRAADMSMRCYDACLAGCRLGMFACGIEGVVVPPEAYCDGIQSQTHRTGSGMGFFFECMPHMPAAWRRPRAVPVPGTMSLVPQVNPHGRAR